MALASSQVIDAVAARFAVTVAAGQVFTDRAHPLEDAQLPSWKIFAGAESIDSATLDGVELHDLDIQCQGFVKAITGLDDAMHALVAAALTQLYATPFNNFTLRTTGINRQMAEVNGADVGLVTLRLQALFHTYASAPEVLI